MQTVDFRGGRSFGEAHRIRRMPVAAITMATIVPALTLLNSRLQLSVGSFCSSQMTVLIEEAEQSSRSLSEELENRHHWVTNEETLVKGHHM